MRGAYIECHSGIAGDMFVGALIDVGLDFYVLREAIGRLPLSGYSIGIGKVKRSSIRASHFRVDVHEHQPARYYEEIKAMVEAWEVDPRIRARAIDIFDCLGEAEAKVHGTPKKDVHFHEVGAVDSIIDVCAAAWGIHHLELERIVCSPVNLGSGTVGSEHGLLPVPAPATLELLRGIPVYSEGPAVELTTPTGAAVLRSQAERFGPFPAMSPRVIGLGAGSRELDRPNLVRITVGRMDATESDRQRWHRDEVDVLETHLDDVTAEVLGFLTDKLLDQGALDVSHGAVTMKKNRPGTRLTIIAPADEGERLAELVVRETGTLGIRIRREPRLTVPREIESVDTQYGQIRVKVARLGDDEVDAAPEYDDCALAAKSHGVPLREVFSAVAKARHQK